MVLWQLLRGDCKIGWAPTCLPGWERCWDAGSEWETRLEETDVSDRTSKITYACVSSLKGPLEGPRPHQFREGALPPWVFLDAVCPRGPPSALRSGQWWAGDRPLGPPKGWHDWQPCSPHEHWHPGEVLHSSLHPFGLRRLLSFVTRSDFQPHFPQVLSTSLNISGHTSCSI